LAAFAMGCGDGGSSDSGDGQGGEAGERTNSGGSRTGGVSSGGSSSGGSSSGGSSGGEDECERPYNGCAVLGRVSEFAGSYDLEASVINSCPSLGIFVSSDAVDVNATLDIVAKTGVARLQIDDSDYFVEVDPQAEDFFPRDFSMNETVRWYAYAREWEVNGSGLSEGFNFYLDDALEFSNTDQGGQNVALRLYTQNNCSIDFTLVGG
jgi:hypothetical protein